VRLVSFSVHWIRAEIHEFIFWRQLAVIVKVPRHQGGPAQVVLNLRSAKKSISWLSQDEVDLQVAADLGCAATRESGEMEKPSC